MVPEMRYKPTDITGREQEGPGRARDKRQRATGRGWARASVSVFIFAFGLATLAFCFLMDTAVLAQCAMCRTAVEGAANVTALSHTLNLAILVLLLPSVAIMSMIFLVAIRYRNL